MNRLVFSLLFLIFFSFLPKNESKFFIGTWESKDKKNKNIFIFKKNESIYFKNGQEKYCGKNFKIDEKKHSLKYSIKKVTDGFHLDVVLIEIKNPSKVQKLLFLVQVVNEDEIRIASNYDGVRPVKITNENSSLLYRIR